MAVSQFETIVVSVLTYFTLRLVKKLSKRWSSKRASKTLRDWLWNDESDRLLPSTTGDEGEIEPSGTTYSTRGPVVDVSEDDSEQAPREEFDMEEFTEVFRKNFPAGSLPLRYAKSVMGDQRREDYCQSEQLGRSDMEEDETRPCEDGIRGSNRDLGGNPRNASTRNEAEGSVDDDDTYRNYPEGLNTGRPVVPPQELKPVGRIARYRYINKDGQSEKPTQFFYTSMDGRFKNIQLPCGSCQALKLTARECLQQNISHRGLSPRKGRSMARSKPTRTGWHPSWVNGTNKNRSRPGNSNGSARVTRGKSAPKNQNRSAPANKRRASILKGTGAERPARKGSFAAFLNQSYPNTEEPKPSTSRVAKGTVSGRGRRL